MADRAELIPFDDHRLGRHVLHDEASKAFRAVAPRALPELRDVRHRRRGRRLNQGQLGACTFFALCHVLKCSPLWRGVSYRPALSVHTAQRGYARATELDPFPGTWPPDDTGSSGLAACKAAMEVGLLTRYDHAFGGAEARAALLDQAVMQGTYWTDNMFHPDRDGRVHPTGGDRGGHQYCQIGLDVERRRTWCWQTWGEWGLDGSGLFYLTWDDQDALLARHGDVQVPRIA